MAKVSSQRSTQWTLIVHAQGQGPAARAALDQLIRRYEPCIVGMIRYWPHPPGQAPEDIKQAFLARVIQDIAVLDRTKGSFRAWLMTALRRHRSNAWKAWFAQKNAESKTDYPETFEASDGQSAEQTLERKFAVDTLSYVLEQLRATAPDAARFDALKRFLPGPEMSLDAVEPVAAALGMTPTALRVAIYRQRERFEKLLTEAVADTLALDRTAPAPNAEVEREKRLLYRSLCEPSSVQVHLQPGES